MNQEQIYMNAEVTEFHFKIYSLQNILAFRGILNLSIISSLCGLLVKEGSESETRGSLEIPKRTLMPWLHSARERVTNDPALEVVDLRSLTGCG